MVKLIAYADDTVIEVGSVALLDGNFPVTVSSIVPPVEDLEGEVEVRFEWGAGERVAPGRLGAYIAD